jgi:hypothetical protein
MPPITEMDTAMAQPAPKPVALSESDTLTPVMPQASGNETTDERITRMEQELNTLRADYSRIMPAFASLNTTNDRIQTLLDELERTGKVPKTVAAERAASSSAETAAMAMEQKPVAPSPVLADAPATAPQTSPFQPGKVSTAAMPDKILPAGAVKTAGADNATPLPSGLMKAPAKTETPIIPAPAVKTE